MDVCMLVTNDARRDPRVQKEAKSLVRAGYSVTVIALTRNDEDVGWEDAEGGYRVHRIRGEGAARQAIKKQVAAATPRAFRFLTRQLRRVRRIPEKKPAAAQDPSLSKEERERRARHAWMITGIRTHYTQARVMAQAAILTAPHVVHAHDLDTLLAAAWAARVTGAALVYDSHELFWEAHAEGMAPQEWIDFYRELQERLIGSADGVMTVCESIAQYFADFHRMEKPLVVRNSIELVEALPPPLERAPDQPIEVLFHGGFHANRGLEELIAAVELFENATLVMRGFGALDPMLKERVRERGLEGKVRFEDPVPMKDVVRAASASDVGVIPYKPVCLNNRFSTPNKLFEYLNAGIAIAASDVPEIARIVKSEDVGLLFDPNDPRSIAAAINQLGRDRPRLAAMKKRARLAAIERHHWAVDEKVLLALYRKLLPRPRSEQLRKIVIGR